MHPITLSIPDTVDALGVKRTTVYKLIGTGQLIAIKIGRRTVVTTDSIRQLVERGRS